MNWLLVSVITVLTVSTVSLYKGKQTGAGLRVIQRIICRKCCVGVKCGVYILYLYNYIHITMYVHMYKQNVCRLQTIFKSCSSRSSRKFHVARMNGENSILKTSRLYLKY